MKTFATIAAICATLAACGGGGGEAPATAAQTCKTVTDTTGDMLDAAGAVTLAGSTRTYSLCCSTNFVVSITQDVVSPSGTIKGSTLNTCQ